MQWCANIFFLLRYWGKVSIAFLRNKSGSHFRSQYSSQKTGKEAKRRKTEEEMTASLLDRVVRQIFILSDGMGIRGQILLQIRQQAILNNHKSVISRRLGDRLYGVSNLGSYLCVSARGMLIRRARDRPRGFHYGFPHYGVFEIALTLLILACSNQVLRVFFACSVLLEW